MTPSAKDHDKTNSITMDIMQQQSDSSGDYNNRNHFCNRDPNLPVTLGPTSGGGYSEES